MSAPLTELRFATKSPPLAQEMNGAERLKQDAREKDEEWRRDFGIGAGGVLRVVENAALRSELSNFSGATFEIDADANGNVVQARAREFSSDPIVWERIAHTAFEGLHVDAARRGRGVRLVVRVEVALKLPSGTEVRSDTGTRAGIFGDLSDVGSHPSRAVSAHLLTMTER